MGGLLNLFDFNQASTSGKALTHKKYADGLEAPRNSLELPIETSHGNDAMGENIPYSYQVMQNSSKRNCYQSGDSMKKLIDEEISKESNVRRNVPSVVARLMGMDMLPSDTKPAIHIEEKTCEIMGSNFPRKVQAKSNSIHRSPLGLKYSRQTDRDGLLQREEIDPDHSSNRLNLEKPRPREHPQEEQLQKFKKEFEAWQAARVWERSRVELGGIPRQWLAREHLNKEKAALYADSKRMTENEKPIELKGHASRSALKTSSEERNRLRQHGYKREPFQSGQKQSVTLSNKTKTSDLQHVPQMNRDEKQGKSTVSTRIVILKPGPDKSASSEESWTGSSEIVEEEESIEDFLEEVKKRLRFEMQGKSAKREIVVRGGGIETPFSEKPSNPRQIARHIAKQVRESVTRDLGMNLLRSESTRSYKSEIQLEEPGSMEFINRDTRKFLSKRMRNVIKEEMNVDAPKIGSGSSRVSMLGNEESILGRIDSFKSGNRGSYRENVKDEFGMQSSSFGHGQQSEVVHMGEMSPRNLVRSLSAPVSGTSFGKLLLEDRHVLTGAHIRRRHEATENIPAEVRKSSKDRFSFKGKVSNFRYSFTLKGKLFGRKIQSVEESWSNDSDSLKDIMSGPTVVMNFGTAQENSTEVPPSPASVCSSAHEELCRTTDHPGPILTLDVPLIEDRVVPQVFREISSNLQELRRQLNQLEYNGSVDMTNNVEEEEPLKAAEMVDKLVGQAEEETYIRDLLIVSGLYDGSFSRWDPFTKPIGNWVFEKVEEESYFGKRAKKHGGGGGGGGGRDEKEQKVVDHKVLFDLLNEALLTMLGPYVTMSTTLTFKRKMIMRQQPPRGKELFDGVWRMICMYMYPLCDDDCSFYSLDGMISRDLMITPWSGMMNDDVDVIAREIEGLIIGELIEETTRDLWLEKTTRLTNKKGGR